MLFDLHNDFPTAFPATDYGRYLAGFPEVTPVAVIWTSELGEDALGKADRFFRALSRLASPPPIAIEDLGFLTEAEAERFDFGRYFYCSLTWNADNRYAGGALGGGTLTRSGRRMISRMNGRCAVDLAHLNKKSFYAALDASRRPLCSHTGFSEGPRCLDDGMIRALIDRGGIIGLCAVTAFTGARTVEALAAEIARFIDKYGAENLCIGTDLCGSTDLPDGFGSYADLPRLRDALYSVGCANAADDIFYGNAKRFYEELQHERHL